jgi:hypothetical protein
MEAFWQLYKPQGTPHQVDQVSKPAIPQTKNDFKLWMQRHQGTPNLGDEYARYCVSGPIFENVDARTWWLEKTQQINYPNLSKMALDILSIPAMSADPERLFSSAKLVLTDLRNRLGMDILEAFECLKSWYKLKPWKGDAMWAEEVLGEIVGHMQSRGDETG